MITILKGKDITVEWKVVSLDTKQPVDFEGVNAKVFLLAPDNIYTLPFDVVRDDFRGLRMTIPTGYISTGVYDLKVIWLKDALKDKPVYRNVSVKREVFALTDEASEVTYDGDTIKIATGVESCGRDGLSAYEIAVFRGFAKESSEKEWVESLDDVLASEESRVEAEKERVKAEDDRVKGEDLRIRIFTNGEEDRRQSFEISQSNRDTEFQNFLGNKEQSYIAAENKRDSSYYNRELLRDGQFETEERARSATFLNNEQERNKAEEDRKKAEEDRKSTFEENEANRQSTFRSNEDRREEKETLRGIEEEKRDNAETIRKENETKRVDAEISREERTAKAIASIANKVDRDDNAPKLTAGFANNLVGRGEATSEEIGFRPSGGDTSIEDGTARIERLKGSTVVWNQVLNITEITAQFEGPLYTADLSEGIITVSKIEGGTNIYDQILCYFSHNFVSAHQYLIIYNLKRNDGQNTSHSLGGNGIYDGTKYHRLISTNGKDYKFFSPTESFTSTLLQISQAVTAGAALSYTIRPVIYDLTQMFGAGNEPTTIEEFNARKPLGIDEYAYNEGELISTTADEIKSVGFNAWDEEWELGGFFNGIKQYSENYSKTIRSKNYIPVIGGAEYGITSPISMYANFFDSEYRFVSATSRLSPNEVFVVPEKAAYMWLRNFSNDYGTVYNNDICLHLTHTGYRNGEYEPYKEFRRSLPISEIKDSEGNVLFPNGLLSAGSVYDEITATKAIKRIGVLDMGTMIWRRHLYSGVYAFRGGYNGKTTFLNLLTSKYPNAGEINASALSDKTFRGNNTAPEIFIRDDSYTDADTFKAAISGVMLYYELAEPIEVDLPEPLNLDYEVSDFGTEEAIASQPSSPLRADVVYQFNAVDRVRTNTLTLYDLVKRVQADKTTVEEIENRELKLSVKDNGNIVLSNDAGVSKEFMPATPSGDPMHWAYLSLPFVEYDADTNTYIVSGYGGLTSSDMRHIYSVKDGIRELGRERRFYSSKARVIIPVIGWLSSIDPLGSRAFIGNTYIEQLKWANNYNIDQGFSVDANLPVASLSGTFHSCSSLHTIYPIRFVKSTNVNDAFYGCVALVEVRLVGLQDSVSLAWSSKISKKSILYAIEQSTSATAITITLHPDAYARIANQPDILEALASKPLITLVSA